MEVILVSLLNGLVYGMLLFMLASGLTLIFSMMGVLNFAHASIYMLGAYFAFETSRFVGFWPALIIAPALCGLLGAAIEVWGLRRVHQNGHIAELLFTFGLVFIIGRSVQMGWGMLPEPYRVPALLDFPLFTLYGCNSRRIARSCCWFPPACWVAIWLLLKRTRIGLIIQAALTHPGMVAALGHNVPRSSPSCSPAAACWPGSRASSAATINRPSQAWPMRWGRSCLSLWCSVGWGRWPAASSPRSLWAWSPPLPW